MQAINNAASIALAGESPLELSGLRLLIEKSRGRQDVLECVGLPDGFSRHLKKSPHIRLFIAVLNDCETQAGLDAVVKLKTERPNLKILVLCGSVLEADADLCEDRGIEGYLIKYAGPAELREAVRAILDGGNYYSFTEKPPANHTDAYVKRAAMAERFSGLSVRKIEVLRLFARGFTIGEISCMLGMAESSISVLRQRFFDREQLHKSIESAALIYGQRVL